MEVQFRKASTLDLEVIWEMLQDAIQRRKVEGSKQWQDGYPNMQIVQNDIDKQAGYVMHYGSQIVAYVALFVNDEPAYEAIEGKWLSEGDFVVYHRVVVAKAFLGKGLMKHMLKFIETFAIENKIYSVRADTNFDNVQMLKVFSTAGYTYCGEVYFRGAARSAFEKLIS